MSAAAVAERHHVPLSLLNLIYGAEGNDGSILPPGPGICSADVAFQSLLRIVPLGPLPNASEVQVQKVWSSNRTNSGKSSMCANAGTGLGDVSRLDIDTIFECNENTQGFRHPNRSGPRC